MQEVTNSKNMLNKKKELGEYRRTEGVLARWNNVFIKAGNVHKVVDSDGICKPGEITGIIGPVDSGKSSLINALTGNLKRSENLLYGASILYNGEVHTSYDFIGYIKNSNDFVTDLTVNEHMKLVYASNPNYDRDIRELYRGVLLDCASKKIEELTIGEKYQLKIAENEILQKQVLFVDFGHMDPSIIADNCRHLRRLCDEYATTVVITSHVAASKFLPGLNRIILMTEGCTFYQGTYENIKKYFEEKTNQFMNEYHMPFKFNTASSTSRLVNDMLTVSTSDSERSIKTRFLSDEYFRHKTGTECNPFLSVFIEQETHKKVEYVKSHPLELYLFYLKYFTRKAFSMKQFVFNLMGPQIIFLMGVLIFYSFFPQTKAVKFFAPKMKNDIQLLSKLNKTDFYQVVSFDTKLELTPIPLKSKDTVIFPVYAFSFYPVWIIRLFLLTPFSINLFTLSPILKKMENKQDFYKKHRFIRSYLITNLAVWAIECVVNTVALCIGTKTFDPVVNLRMCSFHVLVRITQILTFILIYKVCLIMNRYRAMTINLALLIVKSMVVTGALLLWHLSRDKLVDYESNSLGVSLRTFFLYSVFGSSIIKFVVSQSIMVCMVIGLFVVLKIFN